MLRITVTQVDVLDRGFSLEIAEKNIDRTLQEFKERFEERFGNDILCFYIKSESIKLGFHYDVEPGELQYRYVKEFIDIFNSTKKEPTKEEKAYKLLKAIFKV